MAKFGFYLQYFVRKNWRGGEELVLKNGTNNRWLHLLTIDNPGPDLIARGPWHCGNFCNVFLPNIIGEDQKKSYHPSAGHWHYAIW